jgi:hypothetical protein
MTKEDEVTVSSEALWRMALMLRAAVACIDQERTLQGRDPKQVIRYVAKTLGGLVKDGKPR